MNIVNHDDRHGEAGRRASRRQHGHDARDASGRAAFHSREERSALADQLQYLSNVTDKFLEAVDNNEWFQLEFQRRALERADFRSGHADDDYVVYRRPDGSTVTFRDKESFRDCGSFRLLRLKSRRVREWSTRRDIWNRIIASAHKYAEPGIAFIDEVNRHNHMMKSMGPIMSCNPCGEQFLHFANSCNLGSIDVTSSTIAKIDSIGIVCAKSRICARVFSTT